MNERVAISLSVTVGGKEHKIPGGNVRGLSLQLTSWGVEGWVEFVLQDDKKKGGKYEDKLLSDFVKPDLGEVTISIEPGHLETKTKATDAAISTGGLVLDKSVREETTTGSVAAPSVLFRRYRLTFADPARALWRQHFPCALYTNKSFKDVVEAHKGAKISLTYDWDAISAESKLISFSLPSAAHASFYDLVLWYVREHSGVFVFDHKKRAYSIKKAKDSNGTALSLPRDDVRCVTSHFLAPVRHKPRVLNSYTESSSTAVGENTQAADAIYRDVLIRCPIADDVDACVAAEKARPLQPARELELSFARFPTVATSPGQLLELSTKGGHSGDALASTEPFRVDSLSIEGRALDDGPEATYGEGAVEMSLGIAARLSTKSDPRVPLPMTPDPHFPWFVEGKVVSEVGEKSDVTYDLATDQATSLVRYRIQVPLFENQEIQVPYEPATGAGNLYLPLYKGQRVLVAMGFQGAHFDRLLDWRPEAKVAKDGQGQHLFLGKSAKSNTSVRHEYENEKPVLRMLRTNDKDTVLFRLEEGKLTLKVEEQKA